jgi:hypothetical protein
MGIVVNDLILQSQPAAFFVTGKEVLDTTVGACGKMFFLNKFAPEIQITLICTSGAMFFILLTISDIGILLSLQR